MRNYLSPTVIATLTLLVSSVFSQGQIYVGVGGYTGPPSGFVGEYDQNTGDPINSSLVSPLSDVKGISLSGSDLYIGDAETNTVGIYNAVTGVPINSTFLTGIAVDDLIVSGNTLYVSSGDSVLAYDATTGTALTNFTASDDFLGGSGMAISGSDLYISGNNHVVELDAATGATIQDTTVSGALGLAIANGVLYESNGYSVFEYNITPNGLSEFSRIDGTGAYGIAASGTDLYVADYSAGTIGEYDIATGSAINASLVGGLGDPNSVIVAVPEPSELWEVTAGLIGIGLLASSYRRRQGSFLRSV